MDPALSFFQSLNNFADLQQLVDNGEAEGPHLECKSPASPQLNRGLRVELAEAVSGFANSGGGVIIWGISASRHPASGLDVLTQIVPIGNCRIFGQQIDRAIPTIAYPSVQAEPSKILVESVEATRGVVVTYIPPTSGDPVQSLLDREFYFRIGDHFDKMPYEILKRMFLGTAGPDLYPIFDNRLVSLGPDGTWNIPIILENRSSAVAEHTQLSVEILNPDVCQNIRPDVFYDASAMNPDKRIYMSDIDKFVYRGKRYLAGRLFVSMKKDERPETILKLAVEIFSSRMRASRWYISVQLDKEGFSLKEAQGEYLY